MFFSVKFPVVFEDAGDLCEKCLELKNTWDIIIAWQEGLDDMQDDDRFSLICTRIFQTFMIFCELFKIYADLVHQLNWGCVTMSSNFLSHHFFLLSKLDILLLVRSFSPCYIENCSQFMELRYFKILSTSE